MTTLIAKVRAEMAGQTDPRSLWGFAQLTYHLTLRSSNAKTGPIPVSTTSALTCPASCAFRGGNGCYAESGPLALHWSAVTRGRRGTDWRGFLQQIEALPPGQLWRHCQAGDLLDPGTAIGAQALADLAEANRGRRGYGYTHHPLTPRSVRALRSAAAAGLVINASCHSESEADAAMAQGVPAVVVVPASEIRRVWTTPAGNRVVMCPAQTLDGQTCERCQLCHKRPAEHVAVAFRAHGSGRRAAERAIGGDA